MHPAALSLLYSWPGMELWIGNFGGVVFPSESLDESMYATFWSNS